MGERGGEFSAINCRATAISVESINVCARVCVLYRIVYTRYVYSCTSAQFQIYSEKALFPFIFSINITLMRHRQTQKKCPVWSVFCCLLAA